MMPTIYADCSDFHMRGLRIFFKNQTNLWVRIMVWVQGKDVFLHSKQRLSTVAHQERKTLCPFCHLIFPCPLVEFALQRENTPRLSSSLSH